MARTPSKLPPAVRERRARWEQAHAEERRAYLKQWRADNVEKIRAAGRRYQQAHYAEILRYQRDYKRAKRQRARALRVQERIAAIRRRWQETKPT